MPTKLSNADKAIRKLENANCRSVDMDAGDAVQWYLDGDHMSKKQLKKILLDRMKEHDQAYKAVLKLYDLLHDCPERI